MRFALSALILVTAPATAQQQPAAPIMPAQPPASFVIEPVAMMIAACDADGDAVVTHDEMEKCVARSFASADPDHKGSIGFIGYSDWALKWLGDANAVPGPFETDTDNDNRVTLAEMQAKFDTIFARLDRDHDGKLTRAELLTIRAYPGSYGFGDDVRGKHKRR